MSFSLIIPLFNEEKNIQFLINEFLNIKNLLTENFEIILVNDCSTDNTLKVINSIKVDKSENIRIINNKKNLGQSWSLHIGIKNSFYDTVAARSFYVSCLCCNSRATHFSSIVFLLILWLYILSALGYPG